MFWDIFSDLCLSAGFSPNAVAKELKIPSGSITAWKNGAVPRAKTLKKIADYFGVSTEFILYGEDPASETDTKEKNSAPEGAELNKDNYRVFLESLSFSELAALNAEVAQLMVEKANSEQ